MSYNHKHPYKNTSEYRAWINMNRVHGKNCIAREWWWWKGIRGVDDINKRNYDSFRNFVGPRPSGHVLVRLDKSRPFREGNVRWGTHSENSRSRGPMKKFSYSRDEELIAELERRGYKVVPHNENRIKFRVATKKSAHKYI